MQQEEFDMLPGQPKAADQLRIRQSGFNASFCCSSSSMRVLVAELKIPASMHAPGWRWLSPPVSVPHGAHLCRRFRYSARHSTDKSAPAMKPIISSLITMALAFSSTNCSIHCFWTALFCKCGSFFFLLQAVVIEIFRPALFPVPHSPTMVWPHRPQNSLPVSRYSAFVHFPGRCPLVLDQKPLDFLQRFPHQSKPGSAPPGTPLPS